MRSHPVSYERLLAFAGDELSGPEAREVSGHVESCEECSRVVDRYRQVRGAVREAAGATPPPETVARAQRLFDDQQPARERGPTFLDRVVAALTFDSRSGFALAGARGATEAVQLAYESPTVNVDVQIFPPTGRASGRWHLLGQVTEHGGEVAREAHLHRKGHEDALIAAELGEDRMFDFDVETGAYEVRIKMPGRLVILPGIEVP